MEIVYVKNGKMFTEKIYTSGGVGLRLSGRCDFLGREIKQGDVLIFSDSGGRVVVCNKEDKPLENSFGIGLIDYDSNQMSFTIETDQSVGLSYILNRCTYYVVGNKFVDSYDELRAKTRSSEGISSLLKTVLYE